MEWDAISLSASHFVPPCQPPCGSICLFVVLSPFVPDKAGRPGLWFAIWLCLNMASSHMGEAKDCATIQRLSTKLSSALTCHGSHIRASLPSELLEELATLSLRTQWEGLWGQVCAASLGTGIGTGPAQQASFWGPHPPMLSLHLNRSSDFLETAARQFFRTKYVLTLC